MFDFRNYDLTSLAIVWISKLVRQRDLEQMKVFIISFITACYGQSNTFQQGMI